jgi:DNA transposition AAA+ family ATPase
MTVAVFPETKASPVAPGEAALEPAFIDEVRRNFQQHKSDRGYSEKVLADRIGRCTGSQISDSAVGNFLRDKYGAGESEIARKVAAYLEVEDARLAVGGEIAFVKTTVSREVERAIMIGEKLCGIVILSLSAGMGKTRILHETRGQRNSLYISCSDDLNTKWAIASELAYKLTRDDRRRRSPSMARRQIVEMLVRRSRPTIIVDEAQKIDLERVDYLRCIADQAACPLVIAGNEQVYERSDGSAAAHAQYTSRVVARVHISSDAIKAADIRLIAHQMVAKETADQWIDLLQKAASQEGGFRTVRAIIDVAKLLFSVAEPNRAQIIQSIHFVKGGGAV